MVKQERLTEHGGWEPDRKGTKCTSPLLPEDLLKAAGAPLRDYGSRSTLRDYGSRQTLQFQVLVDLYGFLRKTRQKKQSMRKTHVQLPRVFRKPFGTGKHSQVPHLPIGGLGQGWEIQKAQADGCGSKDIMKVKFMQRKTSMTR